MTVKELIEELRQYDQDVEVEVERETLGDYDVAVCSWEHIVGQSVKSVRIH